jgi:hypothetical protein
MVWIAESPPYDADDKKLLKYLRLRMSEENARKTLHVMSLYKYLGEQTIKSPKDIETSAYYDEERTRPVFTPKVAKSLFSLMKKSGGAGDEALVLDRIIRGMITFIQKYLPLPVTTAVNKAYSFITVLKRLQQMPGVGPFVDIGKEAVLQGTKSLVVAADTVAAEVGGPVGEAAVALPAAIAVALVAIAHLLEDELGEALLVVFLAIPFIGPVLYKAAGSLGKFGRKIYEHKDAVVGTTRSFLGDDIGDKVEYLIPNMDAQKEGAKRFSTRRRRITKWRRTRSVRR